MLVTLSMLCIGGVAESFGLRRAILGSLTIAAVGRAIYCLAPNAAGAATAAAMVIVGLLLVAGSSGVLPPVCYSGMKQFTDERTSSMGYAAIYAFMNLGIVVIGAFSAWVRPGVQDILDPTVAWRSARRISGTVGSDFAQRGAGGQLAVLRGDGVGLDVGASCCSRAGRKRRGCAPR